MRRTTPPNRFRTHALERLGVRSNQKSLSTTDARFLTGKNQHEWSILIFEMPESWRIGAGDEPLTVIHCAFMSSRTTERGRAPTVPISYRALSRCSHCVALAMQRAHHNHAVPTGSRSGAGRSPPRDESSERRDPGRNLDCAHHEYRWKPAHGPRVLSRLLRDGKRSLSGAIFLSSRIVDIQPSAESSCLVQTDGAHCRHDLLRGNHRGG
jgi:hypothetical protein